MAGPEVIRTALRRSGRALTGALLLAISVGTAVAWELEGSVELEGRHFPNIDSGATTGSIAGNLELFRPFAGGDMQFVAELFHREDLDDRRRSHGDVRQAYMQGFGRDLEFTLGYRRVFWGVTESRSLVDTINQTDLVEDIRSEDKLGQPLMHLRWFGAPGTLDTYLLAGTRKRTFPAEDGFPRIPFPIATSESRFPGGRQHRLDLAARWAFRPPGMDIAVSWFQGTGRSPDFLPCLAQGSDFPGTQQGPNCNLDDAMPDSPLPPALISLLQLLRLAPSDAELEDEIMQEVLDNLVLVPDYRREKRLGVELQRLMGGLALRSELLLRRRAGDWTFATVSGLEYTLPGFFETGWDVGLLFEYLYDGRDDDPIGQRFSNDLFFGTRISLNDIAGTLILAGAIVEPDFGNRLYSIEASRRLGAHWRIALDVRLFDDLPDDPIVELIDGQDQIRLRLTRFF